MIHHHTSEIEIPAGQYLPNHRRSVSGASSADELSHFYSEYSSQFWKLENTRFRPSSKCIPKDSINCLIASCTTSRGDLPEVSLSSSIIHQPVGEIDIPAERY
jgi:hypothetical protein